MPEPVPTLKYVFAAPCYADKEVRKLNHPIHRAFPMYRRYTEHVDLQKTAQASFDKIPTQQEVLSKLSDICVQDAGDAASWAKKIYALHPWITEVKIDK